MANDLGDESDQTFRPGGALDKLQRLARHWEGKWKVAERSRRAHRLERAAWAFAGALGASAFWYYRHR
jgi:hypothetical protein